MQVRLMRVLWVFERFQVSYEAQEPLLAPSDWWVRPVSGRFLRLSLLLERGFELRLRSNSLQVDPYRWCCDANLSTDSVAFLALIRPMDAPKHREPLNPILEIASLHTLEDPCRSSSAVGPDRRSSRALSLLWRGIIEENREYEVKTEAPEVMTGG